MFIQKRFHVKNNTPQNPRQLNINDENDEFSENLCRDYSSNSILKTVPEPVYQKIRQVSEVCRPRRIRL